MRPDKKKKYRGKPADKSEDAQTQSKNVVSKVSEKEEVAKTSAGESSEKSQPESTDKSKAAATTPTANEVSTENLPPANLRRETDALKETKKPSKRQIFSDWKEYDKPILPEEVEEEQFRDFSSLIQQNITEYNYFKFKYERQWENDSCNINKDLFNLNLQELSAGLQCIPFYKRLNISAHLFSANEVKRMDNYAKEQEKVYEAILNDQESVPIYHKLEKIIKEPEIQPVEKPSKMLEEDRISDTSVSHGGNLQLGNELVKCLAVEKQDTARETSLVQERENKAEDINLDFFSVDNKPMVDDAIRINKKDENKLQSIKKEEAKRPETDNSVISPPIPEDKVKHESKEAESMVKPSEESPMGTDSTESGTLDMAAVFESAPLGQRVKPRRSRETKAKDQPKVVSPAEDEQILNSLLSLKEPTIIADDSKKEEEEVENEADDLTNDLKSIVIHDKKENLEDWLDSMLDD